jgi:hypothetical protein
MVVSWISSVDELSGMIETDSFASQEADA